MMRHLTALSLFAVAAAASSIGDGEDGPSSKVAELAALDHYAGSWKTTFSGDGGASTTAATTTGKWILGGRFMQQMVRIGGEGGAAATEVLTITTFDVDRKVYKSWRFLSDGGTMPSEGTWDAEKKTMKSTARSDGDGGRIEITADFSETGKEKWKIDLFDVAGAKKSTITGTNVKENK